MQLRGSDTHGKFSAVFFSKGDNLPDFLFTFQAPFFYSKREESSISGANSFLLKEIQNDKGDRDISDTATFLGSVSIPLKM